ncbi:NAD(P)H-dependent oxidoreductase [Bosea sp. CRIB-10]|uniref:NADPH-dependent FMN reductase n=1 Tax=Bosea sp. CRIB-10 TaxID=378404 RepID=UPI001AECDA21|nr:NAD(P)H-dependent oxidoreductase [Bosea sp. CRIB-10]
MPTVKPLIVGIGGTPREQSSTELALRQALEPMRGKAEVRVFAGRDLLLPLYQPGITSRDDGAAALVSALMHCDGLIIASPAYHGSVSGLIKNALDYAEELAGEARPYLDGVPIGLIACAAGWQAAGQTLATLRTIAHALRGWPTPYGATIRTVPGLFAGGTCSDPAVAADLGRVGKQVLAFTQSQASALVGLASVQRAVSFTSTGTTP